MSKNGLLVPLNLEYVNSSLLTDILIIFLSTFISREIFHYSLAELFLVSVKGQGYITRLSFLFIGKQDMQSRLDSAMQEVNEKYILLEDQEKKSVRTALVEERGRFCHFVACLKPFVVCTFNITLTAA